MPVRVAATLAVVRVVVVVRMPLMPVRVFRAARRCSLMVMPRAAPAGGTAFCMLMSVIV